MAKIIDLKSWVVSTLVCIIILYKGLLKIFYNTEIKIKKAK